MAEPVVSRQIEFGIRKNGMDNLTTTFSLYQIRRPGVDSTSGNEVGEEVDQENDWQTILSQENCNEWNLFVLFSVIRKLFSLMKQLLH